MFEYLYLVLFLLWDVDDVDVVQPAATKHKQQLNEKEIQAKMKMCTGADVSLA